MKITVDSSETIVQRIKNDNNFAKALLDEALNAAIVDDEPEVARIHLRDLVNGTIGFERLAKITDKNPKSLHRMLSSNGNPNMDNLVTILATLCKQLGVTMISFSDKAA